MQQPWQDYQNQTPNSQMGHPPPTAPAPRPPSAGPSPLVRTSPPSIPLQTQKSAVSLPMPPPPPPGRPSGGAALGGTTLPPTINGIPATPSGSLPGLVGMQVSRAAPAMPVQPVHPQVERIVHESEFEQRLMECLMENEEVNMDLTAMRMFEGLLEDFIVEVGSRAAKVAHYRKATTLASKDIGLSLGRGFGLSVPGCSAGVIVPTQQSTVLGEYGRTVAAVRRTNTSANKGQLRDQGGGK